MRIADHLRRNQPEVYAVLMELCGWPDLREPDPRELAELDRLMREAPKGGEDEG